MQDEIFAFKIRLLKAGGCDMVLGIDWIDVVAQVVLNTRPHSLRFMKDGKIVTLIGVNAGPEVIPIDTEALRRMLHRGTCEVMDELSLTTTGPIEKGEKETYPHRKGCYQYTMMCSRSQPIYHLKEIVIMLST